MRIITTMKTSAPSTHGPSFIHIQIVLFSSGEHYYILSGVKRVSGVFTQFLRNIPMTTQPDNMLILLIVPSHDSPALTAGMTRGHQYQPIRGQYSGHLIRLDQSEGSMQGKRFNFQDSLDMSYFNTQQLDHMVDKQFC